MTPTIFPLITESPAAVALLGENPTRFFPFGYNDSTTERPYAVWQLASGQPVNYLDCLPDGDTYTVQIDIYADTAEDARATAEAVRDAIEQDAYITRWGGESREPETKLYRYSFDSLFYQGR